VGGLGNKRLYRKKVKYFDLGVDKLRFILYKCIHQQHRKKGTRNDTDNYRSIL
jgi:hypothetical protein